LDTHYDSWVPKKQDNENGFGEYIGIHDIDTTTNSNISKKTDLMKKLRSLQHESPQRNETIKDSVQSRRIKGDGRFTFRRGNNDGKCRCEDLKD
jgi:hypothetical protein